MSRYRDEVFFYQMCKYWSDRLDLATKALYVIN